MATGLANRAAPKQQTLCLFRLSLNSFLRSFSTSTENPNASSSLASKKPKRKKKKNLFEVAQFLPNWGIGYHMAKSHWSGLSYQITKINLYKDGRHGKAWGIVHKEGLPAADAPRKISGVHKRCWKYIASLSKAKESIKNSTISIESTPKAEVPAA
ncbi:hypothetical protein CFOL_v3_17975 [Cephalotus follicularis]|uniref:Uncharacterized protein n=1 Tax=Cephalotus follicularis TaxID=3775 RepID=A0A1Q3C2Q5_CEPFO|nr:hypothetical protein CFOL_v3_17975 [Cephalotus follicularis]